MYLYFNNRSLRQVLGVALALALLAPATAQQFIPYPIPFDYPGLSAACLTALNTTVTCHPILPKAAPSLPRLNLNDLNNVCTSECLTSLQSVRTKILGACKASDIMTVRKVKYPATYIVDYLIYAYTLMCRRDPSTQSFCDVLIMQWLEAGTTKNQACSDCILGAARIQLNSPFGYNVHGVSRFRAATSSCSKTNHPLTSPLPYALSTATTSSSASLPTYPSGCVTLYTTGVNNTCNGIASQRNVSSFAVYGTNGIRDCSNIPAGKKICLFGQCKRYQVKLGDTCQSILTANRVSVDAEVFTAWNPNIRSDCQNIKDLVGEWICLSYSAGLVIPKLSQDFENNTLLAWPNPSPIVPAAPLPTAPGTITGCLKLRNYQVVPVEQDQFYSPKEDKTSSTSNDCGYIANANDISLALLQKWNPSLVYDNTDCYLKPGLAYCVKHSDTTLPSTSTIWATSSSSSQSGVSSSSTTRTSTDQSSSRSVTASISGSTSPGITSATTNPSAATTTSAIIASTTSAGAVCISGTGSGNYQGLCSYTCHHGYCPSVCSCLVYGQQVPIPDATFPIGYPAPGLDQSYTGLCQFCCLRGYCPSGACTYTAPAP